MRSVAVSGTKTRHGGPHICTVRRTLRGETFEEKGRQEAGGKKTPPSTLSRRVLSVNVGFEYQRGAGQRAPEATSRKRGGNN